MTCTHVLRIIDASPVADSPRSHVEAALQHASRCDRCGAALAASTAVTNGLAGLAPLEAPRDLTASVLARIAQLDERQPAAGSSAVPVGRDLFHPRNWPVWTTTLGGLGVAAAVLLSVVSGDREPIAIVSPRLGGLLRGPSALAFTSVWGMVLAASLALYVAGLFTPIGRPGQR